MKNLLISLFAIMAIVSCSESDGVDDGGNTPTTSTITLSKSSVTFDGCADEEKITFSATADWFAEIVNDSAGGWLSVSPTSGRAGDVSITIKATNNDSSNERSASISIKAGSAQKTIKVTQKHKDVLASTDTAAFYIEVSCSENTLRDHIYSNFGDKVASIRESDKGYLITLRAGFNKVPEQAFQALKGNSYSENKWLKHITIGNGVTSIGAEAFSGCEVLTSITIPNSVTSIGYSAFSDCSALTSITIPNSVTSIGHSAFSGCSALTSITIPNSVTSIEGGTFFSCDALTSVTIGKGVKSIGPSAFHSCFSRTSTSVTIPDNVTSIGQNAFSGCDALTSITIPDRVMSIGVGAFYGCSALTNVIIGDSVRSIEEDTFGSCDALTSITIGKYVQSIHERAFGNNYYNFESVYCKRSTPPKLGASYLFNGATVYVPVGCLDAYKRDDSWARGKTIKEYDFE